MRIKIFITLLLFLAMAGISEEWMTFTTDDGLAHNICRCVAVDHDGVVWVGHGDVFSGVGGVSSWDGETWTTYHSWTTDFALRSDYINDIAVDENNNKWFATGTILFPGGLTKFDGNEWTRYDFDTLRIDWINAIACENINKVWFASYFGVLSYDGTWEIITEADGLSANSVKDIHIDPDNHKWFATINGLSIYDDVIFSNYYTVDGLFDNYINRIFGKEDIISLVHVEENVATTLNGYTWQRTSFDITNILSCLINDDLNIIYGTSEGIYMATPPYFTSTQLLSEDDGLPDNLVNDIFIDFNDNFLICTYSGFCIFNVDSITWSIAERYTTVNSSITVFPNPFNDYCYICSDDFKECRIIDIYGNKVMANISLPFIWMPNKLLSSGKYIVICSESKKTSITITYIK